jgi:hypothetical protein
MVFEWKRRQQGLLGFQTPPSGEARGKVTASEKSTSGIQKHEEPKINMPTTPERLASPSQKATTFQVQIALWDDLRHTYGTFKTFSLPLSLVPTLTGRQLLQHVLAHKVLWLGRSQFSLDDFRIVRLQVAKVREMDGHQGWDGDMFELDEELLHDLDTFFVNKKERVEDTMSTDEKWVESLIQSSHSSSLSNLALRNWQSLSFSLIAGDTTSEDDDFAESFGDADYEPEAWTEPLMTGELNQIDKENVFFLRIGLVGQSFFKLLSFAQFW